MFRLVVTKSHNICRTPVAQGSVRHFAAPGAKVVPQKEDKSFVDTDAEKLSKHVCVNFYVQGEEPGPAIKPDSEYPEWLFKLDLKPPQPLEDLDPEKDGWQYWRELRKRQMQQMRRLEQVRLKRLHLQDSPSMKNWRRF
ncbi:unnamed protein product, partial [Mesorhabditis spiculigera]